MVPFALIEANYSFVSVRSPTRSRDLNPVLRLKYQPLTVIGGVNINVNPLFFKVVSLIV